MTHTKTLTFLALLAGALTLGLARAEEGEHARPDHHRGGPSGAHLIHAVESLDLTAEQQTAIDEIKTEVKAEREARRATMQEGRPERQDALRELLTDTTLDRDAAHTALDEAEALRQERSHTELDSMLDVLEILTPEQRTTLAAQLDEHRQEHAERGGEREGEREGHRRR